MIYLGADHGGYQLKEKVKHWLSSWEYEFEDLGAHEYNPDDDYTDFVQAVANKVSTEDDRSKPWKERTKGILLCRSGGGMCIGANRFKNVRAVYVESAPAAKHARTDNDANIISLAGDWINDTAAQETLMSWLETDFSHEERHERRVQDLERMG